VYIGVLYYASMYIYCYRNSDISCVAIFIYYASVYGCMFPIICPDCGSENIEKLRKQQQRRDRHGIYYVDVYRCQMCAFRFYSGGVEDDSVYLGVK